MLDIEISPSASRNADVDLQLDVCVLTRSPEPGPLLDHFSSTLVAGLRVFAAVSPNEVQADVWWLEPGAQNGQDLTRSIFEAAERGALVVVTDAAS